jgi:uncharacterized protein (TIGR03382 family)
MKSIAIFGAAALVASSASAAFTGFSVDRVINAAGNAQYTVYGNWDQSNITFLNAFNLQVTSGAMNAFHSGLGESSWIPQGTPSASHVSNDSWVTSTGTHVGSQTALDPSFVETDAEGNPIAAALAQPPFNAGWYDATPGTANAVGAGGSQGGYRIRLMQIVRELANDSVCTFQMVLGHKLANTTTALFAGSGQQITIGVPAPGAVALLGLAGLAARRRRG